MVRPMAPLCALLWALLALCSARAAAAVINTGGGGIRGGVRTLVSDWHIILLGCTGIGIFLTIKVRTTCAESEQNTPYMFVDFICLWEILKYSFARKSAQLNSTHTMVLICYIFILQRNAHININIIARSTRGGPCRSGRHVLVRQSANRRRNRRLPDGLRSGQVLPDRHWQRPLRLHGM